MKQFSFYYCMRTIMRINKRLFPSLVLLCYFGLTLVTSCKKDETEGDDPSKEKQIINVSYGSDAVQKMDIYLPANRSKEQTKVLILVHGGAWVMGDKNDFSADLQELKAQLPDYAIFNINYRLANFGVNLWPTQINDVNDAVTFILGKSNEYLFNTNKVAILGASAGAHLALLNAYKFNTDNHVKVMIDLYGPTDMKDFYTNPIDSSYRDLLTMFMNGTPATNEENYRSASPIAFVTAQSPPTIIFHGTADTTVPIYQSDSLYSKLQSLGVPVEYIKYQGEGHGWVGANLTDTHNKIIDFLHKHMN